MISVDPSRCNSLLVIWEYQLQLAAVAAGLELVVGVAVGVVVGVVVVSPSNPPEDRKKVMYQSE